MLPSRSHLSITNKVHKRINITCNLKLWYDMDFSYCAFDLHLQSTGMISITTSIWRLHHGCPPTIVTTTIATPSDEVKQLHGDSMTRRSHKIKDNHMAPAGCCTHRHASRERLQTWSLHTLSQITHLAIRHHKPCKNKLDVLYFVYAIFTWLGSTR